MDVKDRIRIPPKRRGLPLRYEFEHHPAKLFRPLMLLVLAIAIGIAYVVLR